MKLLERLLLLAFGAVIGAVGMYYAFPSWFLSSPFDVSVSAPAQAEVGSAFPISFRVVNGASDIELLSNLDIPDAFFAVFEVMSVTPEASQDSPEGGLGSQTWYFERSMEPGAEIEVVVQVKAHEPGTHLGHFELCNAREECFTHDLSIQVDATSDPPLGSG